jgi:hypothetical protein
MPRVTGDITLAMLLSKRHVKRMIIRMPNMLM